MKKKFLGLGAVALCGVLALTSCDLVSEKSVSESDAVTEENFSEQLAKAETAAATNYDMTKDFKIECESTITYAGDTDEAAYSITSSILFAVDYDNKVMNVKIEMSGEQGTEKESYAMKASVYQENDTVYLYTDINDGDTSTSTLMSGTALNLIGITDFSAAVNYLMGTASKAADIDFDISDYDEYLGDSDTAIKFYVTDGKTFTAKSDNGVLQVTYDTDAMTMYVKGEYDGSSASVQVKGDYSDQSVKHY